MRRKRVKEFLTLMEVMDSSGNGLESVYSDMLVNELLLQLLEPPAPPPPQPVDILLASLLGPMPAAAGIDVDIEVDLIPATGSFLAPLDSTPTTPAPAPAPAPATTGPVPANTPPTGPATSFSPTGTTFPPWHERSVSAPPRGTVRILGPPPPFAEDADFLTRLWDRDRSLTEWHREIEDLHRIQTMRLPNGLGDVVDVSYNMAEIPPPGRVERLQELFHTVQRQRWLAIKYANLWLYRVWRKRSQCNVDLIDMSPVSEADAIYVADPPHRTVYKFHRNDMLRLFMSRLGMADEMLPTPRQPTNPWTNAALTLQQTISVCQQLVRGFGQRGRCPPLLLAAFCEAGYNVQRFIQRNSSMLAQNAIYDYFKNLHDHNRESVVETVAQLLGSAGVRYSHTTLRRFFREATNKASIREWLDLVRDYTLYMNLHVQTRANWYDESAIYRDARRLYERTPMVDPAGPRVRLLRQTAAGLASSVAGATTGPSQAIMSLAALLGGMTPFDVSGGPAPNTLQFLQNTFYHR